MMILRVTLVWAMGLLCAIAGAGVTTETVVFRSAALDRETTYIAALPSPLVAGRHYPVLYLLHGATGSYRDWTEKTTVTELLEGRDLIIVMPDGEKYGWYVDSPLVPKSQFDSAISRDLVADVDKRFPTVQNRRGRAIAGLSMGGHGALSLAAKHPDVYGSASSLSGILDITAHPDKWELKKMLGEHPGAIAEWRKNSVVDLAENFTTAGVALLFDTGLADKTGAVEDSQRLHKKLESLGVKHIYREFPGTHDWNYWGAHVGEHVEFHMETMRNSLD